MPKRSYDQFCPAARALDVVGERWTLLVVRELLLGPKRFTDLADGLPGIGPNVLAERLRHLQEMDIVARRTLPPPAGSAVYELTPLGVELRSVVLELTRWGVNFMAPPKEGDRFRLGWLLAAMQATFRPDVARGLHETYEFRVDGEVFHVRVDDGTVDVRQGHAVDPAFVLTTDVATFMAVGAKLMAPGEALASGAATLEGDPEVALRSVEILGPYLSDTADPGGLLGEPDAVQRAVALMDRVGT